MTYKKKTVPFIIIVLMITGLYFGGAAASVSAAVLSGGESGKSQITYLGNGKDGKGWKNPHCSWGKQFKYTVKTGNGTKVAYCMEPGKDFLWNHTYKATKASKAAAWKKLSSARQRVLALVLYYGYNSGKSAPYGNSNDYYAATQVLVWEAVDGDIKLSSSGKWTKSKNAHDDLIAGRSYAKKNYDWIKKKISAHVKGTSFTARTASTAKTYVMKYSYKSKNWSKSLTDSNKGNYLKRNSGTASTLSMSRSGYKYTFKTATSGSKKAVLVNNKSAGTSQALLVLAPSKSADQTLIFGATDTTKFYVNFRTEKQGTGKIVKTSDDGAVSGFKFKVTCSENGYSKVHTTNSKGLITVNLYPGTYTVTEQLTTAQKQAGYKAAASKKLTVKESKTSSVTMHNKRVKEKYKIVKTSDNGVVSGFEFVIKDSKGKIAAKAVTTKSGYITGSLYPGTYTVSENLTAQQKKDGYIQPPSQKLVLKAGQASAVQLKFRNRKLQEKSSILIKKENADGSSPAGFKFEVVNEKTGKRIECITGEDGTAELDQLELGSYVISEILTDEQKQRYELPESKKAELKEDKKPIVVSFENQPKTTDVLLKKQSVDGNVGNIEFSINGISSWGEEYGPYTAETSDDGTLDFGELYPGTYTIEETGNDESRYEKQEAKSIVITGEEAEPVIVEFENIPSSLFVTKVDGESEEFLDGAIFALYDNNENFVVQFAVTEENEQVLIRIDKASDPYIIADDSMRETGFGGIRGLVTGEKYILKEISAPEGYIASSDVKFIFENNMKITVENNKPVQEIIKPEEPAEPRITEAETSAATVIEESEAPAVESTTVEKEITDKAVKTGDSVNLLMPMGLLLLAMITIAMLLFRRENEE